MALEWTPKKVVAAAAGDILVNSGPALVARLFVETEGITVSIKDGATQVWAPISGQEDEEFYSALLSCGTSLVLSFSGAGTAYILYR